MAALTTGRLKLPYPTLPDTPDIPRDIKALAAKLDPVLPSSGVGAAGTLMPVDSSNVSQFTVFGGTKYWHLNSLRLSKVMNQCSVMLNLTRVAGASTITGGTHGEITDQNVGTLVPVVMRPEAAVSGIFDSSNAFGYIQLGTDGVVWLRGFSTSGMDIKASEALRVTIAYPST